MEQDDDERAAGRARVRELLIEGLSGWDRPRRMDAGEFARMRERLCDRLAYLPAPALAGLVDLIQRHEGAVTPPARPRWPDQGVIEARAAQICPRPVTDRESYARSLLGSAMGRIARADGYLVELMHHARRAGPPPVSYSLLKLRDAAREARRRREIMQERPERVDATERAWWAGYQADMALALALVDDGEARARERAAAKGAA